MNKHFSSFIIVILGIATLSFCSNKPHTKLDKDCLNLSLMDIKDEGYEGLAKFDTYWDIKNLTIQIYLNHITFICDGKPVTGKVFALNEQGEVTINGYLENGKVTGEWSYFKKDFKGIINYKLHEGKITILEYRLFYKGILNQHRVLLDNQNYVDTVFRLNPYQVSYISWMQENEKDVFERKKLLTFKANGDLSCVQIRDSIYINWFDDKDDIGANDLKRGFIVDIVQGKAERCYKIVPHGEDVLYVGKDHKGNYYKHGKFVHFDTYGKAESVFINLNPELYK